MRTLLYTILSLWLSVQIYSQSINVHKADGTTQSFILSEIDSITFSLSNSACPGTPTVTYEGKTYNTVLIGDQCWLKENLDVGIMIQGNQNQTNNGTIEKYCFGDDPNNCNTYGGLYQWNETMQYITTQGTQGICPPGWHIPKYSEFQILANTVNNDGNALKREDQGSGAGQGTNTSGFSALLAGYRNYDPNFYFLSFYGVFWSSTIFTGAPDNYHSLFLGDGLSLMITYSSPFGLSVRCIKN